MRHARTTFTTLHSALADRRSAHRQHRQLQKELATYDTAAARADLTATFARHTPEQSEPLQRLLDRV
jgi:hypothetical protein